MKRNVKITLFICMVILQLAVPVYMISAHQLTLNEGQQFKFKAAPVDPYDAFMGRFLSINLEERMAQVEDIRKYRSGRSVFVTLENDAQGYAKISGISFNRPDKASYYKTKVAYTESSAGYRLELNQDDLSPISGKVYLQIPFDRYYMPETQALKAEQELNKIRNDRSKDVSITVRINKGSAVMEKVNISGITIEDYLNKLE